MDKVMTATQAVDQFVVPGCTVGMGGQNISRCPVSLVHEVVRQGVGGLTVMGCNLSLPLDILAAAGLVTRTEQGSGNLERFGVIFAWRRGAERGEIVVRDYSHLAMASRFLAGSLGLPFMPTKSLLGSDLLARLVEDGGDVHVIDDPWKSGPVVLLRSARPDVSLIHVQRADRDGNVVIDGVTTHEVDMVKASEATIVSAEEVLPRDAFASEPERVAISSAYVSAVVEEPYGAFPTSVYRYYDFYEPQIRDYQAKARAGGDELEDWLQVNIRSVGEFREYLDLCDPDGGVRDALRDSMRSFL